MNDSDIKMLFQLLLKYREDVIYSELRDYTETVLWNPSGPMEYIIASELNGAEPLYQNLSAANTLLNYLSKRLESPSESPFDQSAQAIQSGEDTTVNSWTKRRLTHRLKADKSSLYALVSSFTDLPHINDTRFSTAYDNPCYWLDWTKNDVEYRAFFSVTAGGARLVINGKQLTDDGYRHTREPHRISIDELHKRDMVEENTLK